MQAKIFTFSEVSFTVCFDFESKLGNILTFHDIYLESNNVRITVLFYYDDQLSRFIWKS